MSRVQIGVAAACGLLVAAIGVALYSGRFTGGGGPTAPPTESPTAPPGTGGPGGVVTAEIEEVMLSPQARILAERFKCVCGCNDILAICSCQETPGSRDMKKFLQQLVDDGKSPAEVEAAMVQKYGEAVRP